MTGDLLHHVAKAATDAENAWNTASSSGAQAVQSIFTSLQTLQSQASACAPAAAANRVLSTQRALDADIHQLKTTIRRLSSIVNGLKRWQEELETEPLYTLLRDYFERLLSAFENDLQSKRKVLDSILGEDVFLLSVAEWRRFIALWSEQPDRQGTCGEAVAAIATAEQVMQDSNKSHQSQVQHPPSSSVGSKSNPALSPAMLSLKQRLTKTKA
ncbi:hypothetical protein FGB62_12g330 [Gracilaria domingensis]|nr:hypothetical protein FGB62_12g330 [Gracilaria domingensis]